MYQLHRWSAVLLSSIIIFWKTPNKSYFYGRRNLDVWAQRCWNFFQCCHYVMTVESYLKTLIWEADTVLGSPNSLNGYYQHKQMPVFANSLESFFIYAFYSKSPPVAVAFLSYCSLLASIFLSWKNSFFSFCLGRH